MEIPSVILGTFRYLNLNELYPIICSAFDNGIIGFDTSPSYRTEPFLGGAINLVMRERGIKRDGIFIQDKIDGWQMEDTKGYIDSFVDESLIKLRTDYIDVLFIHWPFPEYLEQTWQSFAKLKQQGKVLRIGLSNVRERHTRKLIENTGIAPDVVQIERHPLRTCNADIKYFQSSGIKVEAYSPLCQMDERLLNSVVLKNLALKYNKNIGQIILRWHIDTGVVPVVMTKKTSRVKENAEIFDFQLNREEISAINSLNIDYKIFLESNCCPGI